MGLYHLYHPTGCEIRGKRLIPAYREFLQRKKWQPTRILAWEIPHEKGAWQATVHGMARAGQSHN